VVRVDTSLHYTDWTHYLGILDSLEQN